MSIQAVAMVLALGPEVRGAARLVLVSLANHAGDTGECWPSTDTIAREAGCHPDTVRDAVLWLVENGYIERDVQSAPDVRIPANRRPNLYRLTFHKVGGVNDPTQPVLGGVSHRPGGGERPDQGGVRDPTKSSLNHHEPRRRVRRVGDNSVFFAPGSGKMEEFRVVDHDVVEPAAMVAALDEARRRVRESKDARSEHDAVEQ